MNINNSQTISQKIVLSVVALVLVFGFFQAFKKVPITLVQNESFSQALESQNSNVFDAVKNFFIRLFSKKTVVTSVDSTMQELLSAYTSNGNSVIHDGGDSVIDVFDQSQNSFFNVGDDGIAFLDQNTLFIENSYIVMFKSKPMATRQKELLKTQGVVLEPSTSRTLIKSKLQELSGDISIQKNKIATEQNKLMSRLDQKYQRDTLKSTGDVVVYKNGSKEIRVQKHSLVLNALSIENVSGDELSSLVKGIGDIVSIEPVKRVKAVLIETPDIINSIDLAQYVGENGAYLTGQGVSIGIIDTGVDYLHQDLGSCSFHTSIDCKVAGGYDFINNDNDPMDDHGHGTHVAATAGGNGFYTDSSGVTHPLLGIAPDVKIYAFKVLGANGSGSSIAVNNGIARCVDPNDDGLIDDRLDVCSMSLGSSGGSPLDSLSLAVDAGVDAGAVFTVAAGNAGSNPNTIGSPGTSRKAITVGASCKPQDVGGGTCSNNGIANFSSRGPVVFINENGVSESLNKPDIVAPGVKICAAQLGGYQNSSSCLGDGEHIAISGTSMATPVVAGLVALLRQAHPEKTPLEIKEAIKFSATDLGLDENTQGAGLIDGIATLISVGIPSSVLGITGLPLSVLDSSSSLLASYTKTPLIKNISESPLSLSFSNVGTVTGVTTNLPSSVILNPNQELAFPLTLNINHETVETGNFIKNNININTGDEIFPLSISRLTPKKLVVEEKKLNFGLFHESQNQYTNTQTLHFNNRMSEQSVTYDVIVDPMSYGIGDNISFIPSQTQITVAPGSSGTLPITVTALASSNNPLPNKNYKTTIRLVSSTEEHIIPVSLFRGYAVSFDFASETPDFIHVKDTLGMGYLFIPYANSSSITLYVINKEPFHAYASYRTNSPGNNAQLAVTYKFNIDLSNSVDIVNYNLDKNLATISKQNTFFGSSCLVSFVDKDEGPVFIFSMPGYITIKHNLLPDNYTFNMVCQHLNVEQKKVSVSQMYISENVNQNYVLNSSNSDTSERFIYGFNHKNPGSSFGIGSLVCNQRKYNYQGGIVSNINHCSSLVAGSGNKIIISENEVAVLESNSLYTKTPETSLYPDYPSTRVFAYDLDTMEDIAVSPELFLTSGKAYSWSSPQTGILTTSTSSHNMYNKYKYEYPSNDFISLGALPIVDTSSLRAFSDSIGLFFNKDSSILTNYKFADGSSEFSHSHSRIIELNHSFIKNQNLITSLNQNQKNYHNYFLGSNSQALPKTDNSFNPSLSVGAGVHEVTSTRVSPFRNESGSLFKKIFSTTISSSEIVDSVPPFIEMLSFEANGLGQASYDPNVVNNIKIKVNPGYGISSHSLSPNTNNAYTINFMSDSLSNITLFKGESLENLENVPLVVISDSYQASVTGGGTGSKEYFRLEAEDLAGNTMSYDFYMPVSNSVSAISLNTEAITECISSMFDLSINPSVIVLNPGEAIPLSFNFTNNSSVGCGTWDAGVSIKNDALIPFNVPIRFGINSSSQPGSNLSIPEFIKNLPSGSSITNNIYLKALDSAPVGTYMVKFSFLSSNIDLPTSLPVDYYLTVNVVSPGEEDTACVYSNPTISFLNMPTSISENGPELPFSILITNNNSVSCPIETYALTVADNSSFIGLGSTPPLSGLASFAGQVMGSSGQTTPIPLYVKAFPGSFVTNANVTASISGTTPSVSVSESESITISGVCEADFNVDNKVNIKDFLLLSAKVGSSNLAYDLTGDGLVNLDDTSYLTTLMGTVCTN